MRISKEIVLASNNRDKFEEFKALLRNYPQINLIPAPQVITNSAKLGAVEKYDTYLENATAKARVANGACHYPCLADDSGLEVDALDGGPGVKSARWAIPKAGQSASEAGIEKLLEALKGRPMANRGARFVCTLVIVMEGTLIHASGAIEGTIAEAPSGKHGFGYDPVFIPKDHNKTFAEMGEEEKNTLSHRARALHNLMTAVSEKGVVFTKP